MRLLLDEDVPEQVIGVLRHLLNAHVVKHVHELRWTGKQDIALFQDAMGKFDAILTNNYHQLDNPDEARAIKRSRIHHISYEQKVGGLRGLALAVGALIAAVPALVEELATADGQRLVSIVAIAPGKRYNIIDPDRQPPRYWPR